LIHIHIHSFAFININLTSFTFYFKKKLFNSIIDLLILNKMNLYTVKVSFLARDRERDREREFTIILVYVRNIHGDGK